MIVDFEFFTQDGLLLFFSYFMCLVKLKRWKGAFVLEYLRLMNDSTALEVFNEAS